MENLEEVLQALDEFQKMRPSEIPRELEDYLCWVAKTGDPVYQWSLIKTLFREKLTRVMTDFYESCPTLDLAPCPNVEHFNYDTMKSNLLERLESFANAPFTVQRICELLTAPRKEYNRVDKFMRAIEKNILVVSTREPGPTARRNENGDGMVNGSVDEDAPATQPPQDVEMEYWEKDCSSAVTISVHTVENVVKNVFATEEIAHDKVESTSKSDNVVSNFIPTTSEFGSVPNLTASPQTQDSQIEPTIQNLSTIIPEASAIVGDVSEAIMNEDTSSQPSLELENDGGETADSSRKLQTTFQTKDFSSNENKSLKFYVDNPKVSEKTEVGAISVHVQEDSSESNDTPTKSDIEPKTTPNSKESVAPIVENLLNASNENLEDTIDSSTRAEDQQTITENTHASNVENKETQPLKNTNTENTSQKERSDKSTDDASLMVDNTSTEDNTSASTTEDIPVDVENLKDHSKETESMGDSKPVVEEPCSKDDATENFNCDQEKDNLTITEATEDETRTIKSIVPDPIPIVQEPKDKETVNAKVEGTSTIVDISENRENQNPMETSQLKDDDKMCIDDNNVTELEGNDITATMMKIERSDTAAEDIESKKVQEPIELMDVDKEETMSVFQQNDEPMEQESAQSSRS